MSEIEKTAKKLYQELKEKMGATRDQSMALAWIMQEYGIERDTAINFVGWGNAELGIHAFYFDMARRNLYLFVASFSPVADHVNQAMKQFATVGLDRIFATEREETASDRFFNRLKACLLENNALIDQIYLRMIFTGDLAELQQSEYLKNLLEQIDQKKYVIDRFFPGRPVRFTFDQKTTSDVTEIGQTGTTSRTYVYDIPITEVLRQHAPQGGDMVITLIRLVDLLAMYRDMSHKFFERNIRYGLGDKGYVNKSISQSFKKMIVDQSEEAGAFAFNHNGVSIAAQEVAFKENLCHVVSPRLLNGAQTVTTFDSFCTAYNIAPTNPSYEKYKKPLEEIRVLCKFITNAAPAFITTVTINNNRQNPVSPWDLHANDEIQLQLQDKLRKELGIYYERQKNAFADIDLDAEEGITEKKEIKLLNLAQTFLACDGDLKLLGSLRDVFEEDALYEKLFSPARLKADAQKIVLCYKIQFRINKLIKEIIEKGPQKYWYLKKAKNLLWALLCQAILNDERADEIAAQFGSDMVMSNDYTAYLADLATRRCRPLLAALEEKNSERILANDFTFLHKDPSFTFCMNEASEKWGWRRKSLK